MPGGSAFAVDKFSLYYPDNAEMTAEFGNAWPLLRGYSFRTAVLRGSLNRAALADLRWNAIPVQPGTSFDAAEHGLIVEHR